MHSQNLTDDRLPLYRHGRAWHKNWSFEWGIFRSFHPGLQIRLDERVGGYLSIGFAYLFVHYLGFRNFEERKFEICFHDGCIWISPWISEDHNYKSLPWYRRLIVLHIEDWIKGKQKFKDVKGDSIEIVIPMPEGSYPATATPVSSFWTRPRWFRKEWHGYEIEIKGSIPFRGKGEYGWDCGDDGLCGLSCEGTLEEAIGRTVASALKSRARYGEVASTRGRVVYA